MIFPRKIKELISEYQGHRIAVQCSCARQRSFIEMFKGTLNSLLALIICKHFLKLLNISHTVHLYD